MKNYAFFPSGPQKLGLPSLKFWGKMDHTETEPSNSPDKNLELGFQSPDPDNMPSDHLPDQSGWDVEEEKEELHVELKESLHLEEEANEEKEEERINNGWNNGGDSGWNDWGEEFRDEPKEAAWVEVEQVQIGAGEEEEQDKYERSSNGDLGGVTVKFPIRPEAEDCSFYMKNGTCKFGFNCKFNHPFPWKYPAVKERLRERDETSEKPGVEECKYYLKTGGCKYGKACRYNHSKEKAPAVSAKLSLVLELNFLGLPIRPGEKECPYYMRNGSCKYGANCRFNHPDPSAAGGSDHPAFGNGGSASLQASSQSNVASWSSQRTLSGNAPFVPMMFSPLGIPPHTPEWNGYQPPVYPPERVVHPPTSYVVNNQATDTNVYRHQQQPKPVDEFPERPGQPDCNHYIKTGDCKFKSSCRFHHPKNRTSRSPVCALSDKGLPLRPDQNICTHYSRYGICKYGPACRFNHPIQPAFPSSSDDQHSPFVSSSADYKTRIAGHGNENATE